jgi:Arc/MetJ-type ribon-helix-helix transcriptional regulator
MKNKDRSQYINYAVSLDPETLADKEFLEAQGQKVSEVVRTAIREKAKRLRQFAQWEERVFQEALDQEEAARNRREN